MKLPPFWYTHGRSGIHLGAACSRTRWSWTGWSKELLSSSFTTLYRSSEGSSVGSIWLLNAIKYIAKRCHPDVSSWTRSDVQHTILPYHSPPWDRYFHHSLQMNRIHSEVGSELHAKYCCFACAKNWPFLSCPRIHLCWTLNGECGHPSQSSFQGLGWWCLRQILLGLLLSEGICWRSWHWKGLSNL